MRRGDEGRNSKATTLRLGREYKPRVQMRGRTVAQKITLHIGAKLKKYWCLPRTGIYHYIRNVNEPFLLANLSKDLL